MKKNIFFLWGEEGLLIDRKIEQIITEYTTEIECEPEIIYLDSENMRPEELEAELENNSLFSLYRVIIIKKPAWLEKDKGKNSPVGPIEALLKRYLDNRADNQVLILTASKHDSTHPLVKWLNKNSTTIHCQSNYQEKVKWINSEFQQRRCNVESGVPQMIVHSEQDMYYMQNLIDKLCLIKVEGLITREDVETEINMKENIKIFRLTDALLRKDIKDSWKSYIMLLEQGEHPIFFLYMIVKQFIMLAKIKFYYENGYNRSMIRNATGLKDFMIEKFAKRIHNFTWENIYMLFVRFLEVDLKMKTTGQNEKILIETLIMEICIKK